MLEINSLRDLKNPDVDIQIKIRIQIKKAKYDASKLITTKNKHSLRRNFQKLLVNLKNYGNLLSL